MSSSQAQFESPRTRRLRAQGLLRTHAAPLANREALRRAQLSQRRGALRPALSDAVAAHLLRRGTPATSVHPWLVAALGALALTLVWCWLDGHTRALLPLAIAFAGGVTWLLWRAKRTRQMLRHHSALDPQTCAQTFDAALASRLARLPDAVVLQLNDIKATLTRLLSALATPTASASANHADALPAEDAFFVRQTVTRYLPNALDLYLALQTPTPAHQTALLHQLKLLHQRLGMIAGGLEVERAAQLGNHGVFLERKLDTASKPAR